MSGISVVSVVLDREMYSRCVSGNDNFKGCRLVEFRNWEENLPVTARYNSFLETVSPDDGWIVFCHEDWEALEPVPDLLARLSPDFIYGPIGVLLEEHPKVDVILSFGGLLQSAKCGRRVIRIKGYRPEGRVDTLDCQCIIVHSSLVCRYGLRFDENLKFDMYAEDFCVTAYERFGIETRATRIACHHHSGGKLSQAFFNSLAYVRNKFADSRKRYATIVGHLNTFGRGEGRPVFKWKRTWGARLRYRLIR